MIPKKKPSPSDFPMDFPMESMEFRPWPSRAQKGFAEVGDQAVERCRANPQQRVGLGNGGGNDVGSTDIHSDKA